MTPLSSTLVIRIPIGLDPEVDPADVARAMRALESRIAGTLLAPGVRLGTPESAIVPTAMLDAALAAQQAKAPGTKPLKKGRPR